MLLRELQSIGPDLVPSAVEGTYRLCADLLRDHPCRADHVERDLPYGGDDRQRLDVHRSSQHSPVLEPVLVFVHGGGFIGGSKHTPGLPFFDNVGAWAVEQGMVGVTVDYRLAPAHRWPEVVHDLAAALAWLRAHAQEHGGDRDRIVLMGHSAGAAHVAGYLAGQAGPVEALAAAVLLSGIYDVARARQDITDPAQAEQLGAYYGEDGGLDPRKSALPGLLRSSVPTLFGVAELDPPLFHRQAGMVLDALLDQQGTLPPFAWVPGHNHFSEVLTLGADPAGLATLLHRFLRPLSLGRQVARAAG